MSDPSRPANRLAMESSPYLRQHAHNPVDWYPWGPEAFERARREDKPLFLSIGYSACHWCHVMERESFENEELAAVLNEHYVSVKVDREERPDVDDVYMSAVQTMVGRGGWPLSAFLFPDGRPFFGGTYFPPEDRQGRAGFRTILEKLAEAWRERRDELAKGADEIVAEVENANRIAERAGRETLSVATGNVLTATLKRTFDARHGGFGGAPKFPPHLALEWLLQKGAEGDSIARSMALKTLDEMALGGIHDHLAGGFHRYSTDERWLLPHFEKMLTDNAQLLSLYARAFVLTGRDFYRRTARGIGDWLLSEMRGEEGGFFAATDADSEGEEGKYFVWSEEEVREVAGDAAALFASAYRVRAEGNFHDESTRQATSLNVLHLGGEPSAEDEARLAPVRARLLALRRRRVPPATDDKRIAGWNSLTVSGLAVASSILGEPRYLEAARECARFLLTRMRDAEGRLLRTWKDGEAKILAFLEDEAYLALALLDLADAEPDKAEARRWAAEARRAVNGLRRRFTRPGVPGFTFTGEGHEPLLVRTRDLFDKAIPSGPGAAARALARLARRDGDTALAAEALAAVEEVSGLMERAPHGMESWHLAWEELRTSGLLREVHVAETGTESGNEDDRELDGEGGPTGSAPEPAGGPVRVSASISTDRVAPGEMLEVRIAIELAEGWSLTGEKPLAVDAWGGPDLRCTAVELPPRRTVRHPDGTTEPGYEGRVDVTLVFEVRPEATEGEHPIAVSLRTRACGEGTCLPERALALTVPVLVLKR
ncbi:MAG TPA: thioredoxin domain-containing protein [Thermoanaerobaculia bacterium]|nr:thioredoxin domain-containing protein [Thermoanaerobaculia bacterium]